MTDEQLEQKITEYYQLSKQVELIQARCATLNDQIKKEMLDRAGDTIYYGTRLYHPVQQYRAELTFRRKRNKPDKGSLEQLICDKYLWAECTRVTVDEDLVEQAYIEGKLTDDDLRSINAGTEIIPSLKVVPIDV